MPRHPFGPAWAATAAGLLALSCLLGPARAQEAEPPDPLPGPASETRTVALLQAERDGLIDLEARGQGSDRVRIVIHNKAPNRLRVVLPPGLVASAAAGQIGGGFQNMGLGAPTDQPGAFGAFRGSLGFRSVAVEEADAAPGIAVPAGATVDLSVPAVCLDFGKPTPTPEDTFHLVSVDDFTTDARARKALRSLATLGTSQKVAQAVAWNVFNGVTFPQMATRARRVLNAHEIALAARFVEVLDASGGSELVDPAYLQQARVFVRLHGDAATAPEASRLAAELETQPLFGMPVRVVDEAPQAEAGLAALFLDVTLARSGPERTVGRVEVRTRAVDREAWATLGTVGMKLDGPASALDAATLADAIDRTIAGTFVRTKVVRREPGRTTLAVENRLPMTITGLAIRAGQADVGGIVEVPGLGLGPARATTTVIPAASGTIERIAFNGL